MTYHFVGFEKFVRNHWWKTGGYFGRTRFTNISTFVFMLATRIASYISFNSDILTNSPKYENMLWVKNCGEIYF